MPTRPGKILFSFFRGGIAYGDSRIAGLGSTGYRVRAVFQGRHRMKRTCALFAGSLLTAFAAAADLPNAGPGAPGHWSVVTGETVSPDRDAIAFELGWPGASFSYLH